MGMKRTNQLTKEECQKLFTYDEHEGRLRWKSDQLNRVNANDIAGTKKPFGKQKYHRVKILGKVYFNHVLIWNYHHGFIPDDLDVDHIKPVKEGGGDNIENLRLLTHSQNIQRVNATNCLGIKYIYYKKKRKTKKWCVQIRGEYLYYDCLYLAIIARDFLAQTQQVMEIEESPKEQYLHDYYFAKSMMKHQNIEALKFSLGLN